MGTRDPKVDAYINKAADFAKPILAHFRETVHAACPDVVGEMKWSFPHFTCKGSLCSMAAFKEHAAGRILEGVAGPRRRGEEPRRDGSSRPYHDARRPATRQNADGIHQDEKKAGAGG